MQGIAVWGCLLALAVTGAVVDAKGAPTPTIRVVSGADRPPFLFVDGRGELRGYEVDAWRLFEQHTGVHVDLQVMAWSDAKRAVLTGQADAIDLLDHTPENDAAFAYTPGYTSTPVSVFVSRRLRGIRNMAGLRGLTIGVVEHHGCIRRLAGDKALAVRRYTTISDLVAAAARGQLAAFCIDEYAGEAWLSHFGA